MIHSRILHKRLGLICFLVLMLAAGPFLTFVTEAQSRNQLEPGKSVVRQLKGGEKHTYLLQLKANDYLNLVVNQKGIDVVVRLLGPEEKVVQEVDSPNGTQGQEPLSYLTETAGRFVLEIESLEKTAQAGEYQLNLETLRTATEQDRAVVEIENLNSEVQKLQQAGKYDQGLPLAQHAVEQSEKKLGPEHPLVEESLNTLALFYHAKGQYQQAEPVYRRALAICEKALGPDHPQMATILNNLARLYQEKGDYQQAEPLYRRSLAIYEKAFGPDHFETATILNNLALLSQEKGDYQQAEPLYRRSLAIYEKTLGPNHLNVAYNLNNLAAFYQTKGDFRQAEPFYQRAVAIFETMLGADHPVTAQSLNNLATLYAGKGDYAQAERLYARALAIREKVLGENHPQVADSLNTLAFLYDTKGDYAQAERLYTRALAIREKVWGATHPSVANSLNNLAALYVNKGDDEKAEPLFQRSLAIREKVPGPDHSDTAFSLNNLAQLHHRRGDYQKAEPLYQRSLAIWKKAFGPDHPLVANSLNNLASLAKAKGDFQTAEALYRRSLAIREKALGPDHPDVAESLNNLAAVNLDKGDYAQAEPLFQRALAIREKGLGPDHPDVALNLSNQAVLARAKGDMAQAIQFQIRCNNTSEQDLRRNLAAGSETQKAFYLKQTTHYTDQTISLHLQSAPHSLAARKAALTVVLRRKGRSLDAMTTTIETLRHHQTPEIQKLLDDFASLVGQISVLTLRGPGTQKAEDHLAYLKELETQKEKLEAEISLKSAEFKAQVTSITLETIQKQIPADGVLVEFTYYQGSDSKTKIVGSPRLAVYTLNQAGDVQWADLGEAAPIEQAVSALRKVLSNPKVNLMTDIKPAAQALDRLVMKPVRKLVGNTRHLLISPDGMLNVIPFAALLDERGKFLVENYTITYLTSGRDLLRLEVKIEAKDHPLVVADPEYGDGVGPQMRGYLIGRLTRLPGTRIEGQQLKDIFPDADLKMTADATESKLKQTSRPELLHIATHGYFLESATEESAANHTPAVAQMENQKFDVEKLRASNPLLRSWLFFTGANQRGDENNDGVMTALEAAQLNLWGTKLVTLSACDTGLGDVKNGDGVYGLRRALVLAGSEAQLMSLWPVSDQGTRELMVDYYTRLKAGEGRSEALRNVQLKMLKTPRRQHPFYWASFIQSGEWANLKGKR
ncbi:MAG: CHAT domain-containing protein [Acidobacteria bacterium]|nr:CHAT domain-containing protein [Acidobacteriota bacterium]